MRAKLDVAKVTRKLNVSKTGAIKRFVSVFFYGVGKDKGIFFRSVFAQIHTAVKRAVLDGGYRVGDNKVGKRRTVRKRSLRNDAKVDYGGFLVFVVAVQIRYRIARTVNLCLVEEYFRQGRIAEKRAFTYALQRTRYKNFCYFGLSFKGIVAYGGDVRRHYKGFLRYFCADVNYRIAVFVVGYAAYIVKLVITFGICHRRYVVRAV